MPAVGFRRNRGWRCFFHRTATQRAEMDLSCGGRKDEAVALLAEVLDSPAGTVTAASLRSQPGLSALKGYPPFEALVSAPLAGR